MVQSTFSIRLEDDVKNDMNAVCESIGMSMSTAFNIFARAFVRSGGFPFDVRIQSERDPWEAFLEARRTMRDRYPDGVGLEEIDEEIKAVRASKNQR